MMTEHNFTLVSKQDQEILGKLDTKSITKRVWQHAEYPRNTKALPHPDGESEVTGICEDTIGFQLCLKGDTIHKIAFKAKGCGFTTACGSITTELVLGKPVKEALKITGKLIRTALGGLPQSHTHCSDLAANALKEALRDAL